MAVFAFTLAAIPPAPGQAAPLPLSFEANEGQTAKDVDFLARGDGYIVFLTKGDAVIRLDRRETSHVLRFQVAGARRNARAGGADRLETRSHYFIGGDRSRWKTNVPNYASVLYQDVYEGVDVRYHGRERRLESEFIVHPGADSRAIRLRFLGVRAIHLESETGDLVLQLTAADDAIRLSSPVAYQDSLHGRETVKSRYQVESDGSVTFRIADYDRSGTLIIDPVLKYGTFLGNTGTDYGLGVAVDGSGNAYITGGTASANFPTTVGAYDTTQNGSNDVFVTKLNAAGSSIVFSTFVGGTGSDMGWALAIDSSGNTYVTGFTASNAFPTVNAFDTTLGGTQDAFLFKLSSTGAALLYSTYYGGNSNGDIGYGIAVGNNRYAYITGNTNSNSGIASAGAFDTTLGGSLDAFAAKFDPTLSGAASRIYGTYLGGNAGFSGQEEGYGIAVDGAGQAYVTGSTGSNNYPTTASAYDTTANGNKDVFLTVLNATGTAPLVYSTYLGGANDDGAESISLDSMGKVYVGGWASTGFPTTVGAYDTTFNGGTYDAQIAKFDTSLSGAPSLVYSTFVGGAGLDDAYGITVDYNFYAHITGYTSGSFPTTANAVQSTYGGGTNDAFYALISPTGANLMYSTYLGGTDDDVGYAITKDLSNSTYIVGYTASANFKEITTGSYDTSQNGGYDAFVVKFKRRRVWIVH